MTRAVGAYQPGHSPRLPLTITLVRMMMIITIIIRRRNLSYILGEHEIKVLHKAAVLGTAHIIQKALI